MGPPANRNEDLEERLRATMRRRAAAVRPRRPDWSTLAGSNREPVLLSSGAEGESGPFFGRTRPVLAAASVLAVVVVAAVVLERSVGGGGGGTEDEHVASLANPSAAPLDNTIPAPGGRDFEPGSAAPVYPVTDEKTLQNLFSDDRDRLSDPKTVAEAFLKSVGIAEGKAPVSEINVDVATNRGQPTPDAPQWEDRDEVAMAWSTWGAVQPAIASGHIYMRRADSAVLPAEVSSRQWIVVGARTDGVLLKEVDRDGGRISFVVSREKDRTGLLPLLRVQVNDELVQEGPVAVDSPQRFLVSVPTDKVAVIELLHVDSVPVSITAMAVPPSFTGS